MTLKQFLSQFAALLEQGSPLAFAVALGGGVLASAVCPCTLPVGLGVASLAGASEGQSRRSGLAIAAAFFGGIVVNLMLLGALAGRLGAIATERFGRNWTLLMAALSCLGAAVAFAGPRLRVEQLARLRRPGAVGAFSYGFVFSLGTSVAPLLVLLTVAAAKASVAYGFALALAFGVGRGAPFLLAGVFASAIMRFVRLGAAQRALQVSSGVALAVVSGYYLRAFVALL
ncbi:MAG TPA: cytochrome c biogenesis protein CcdA [Polyangiaceae bacterium]|nr:cytochrome c biogenesis protein CcdA [Polyangiaceae bacterium]